MYLNLIPKISYYFYVFLCKNDLELLDSFFLLKYFDSSQTDLKNFGVN